MIHEPSVSSFTSLRSSLLFSSVVFHIFPRARVGCVARRPRGVSRARVFPSYSSAWPAICGVSWGRDVDINPTPQANLMYVLRVTR